MREGSGSPEASHLPEVVAHDFAEPISENAEVKLEKKHLNPISENGEDEDEDMEEVDVAGQPTNEGSSISPSSKRPQRTTRIAVDNPYEESDEDEEKSIVSDTPDQEGVEREVAGEDSEDSMDEVDFAPSAEIAPPPQTTRSGRTIKLRIGTIRDDEPKEIPETQRATRSSKRKR
jgi:hypothetical protein